MTHSNFLLAELRRGKQDLFAGPRLTSCVLATAASKLISEKVLLVNNDEPIDNLTFLI